MTDVLNPVTTKKEFGGNIGVLAISLGLPTLLVLIHQLTNEQYHIKGIDLDLQSVLTFHKPWYSYLFNSQVWTYYILWFFGLTAFDLALPGTYKQGVQLRDGTKLWYNINGISVSSLFFALLGFRFWLTSGELPELQFLYHNILDFTIVATSFSFLLAWFVYIISFIPLKDQNGLGTKQRILAVGGNTGSVLYDWFIGRELNPRIWFWDIKLFCELRPGMLMWLLLNFASLHHQWLTLGYVTDSMILLNVLQTIYIIEGVLNEEGCLTMMDITTDGFGFMLSFGDLALVPFSYSLQARYLSVEPTELGFTTVLIIGFIGIIGFYIFKASNNQKDKFRQGKLTHLKSIKTERKTRLLVDGWWKLSQHINYFGDWLYALTWCLSTGFTTPFTYYYSLYFATLLLHRQHRDEVKCREKYGKAWEQYETEVPYKIIPYIY